MRFSQRMFFGSNIFKKSDSGTNNNSPQVINRFKGSSLTKKPDHDGRSPSFVKTALWETICDADLNTSSDLDDSMDFFYSRSNIFNGKTPNSSDPTTPTTQSKPVQNSSISSGTQRWKSRFFTQDASPIPKKNPEATADVPQPRYQSPSLSRFQKNPQPSTISGATTYSSMSNCFTSAFNKSPATRQTGSGCSDRHTINSPKIPRISEDLDEPHESFVETEESFDMTSKTMTDYEEDSDDRPPFNHSFQQVTEAPSKLKTLQLDEQQSSPHIEKPNATKEHDKQDCGIDK